MIGTLLKLSHLAAEYSYHLTVCDTHRIITSTQNNAEGDKKKIAQMGGTIFTVASGVHDLYIVK